MSLSNLSSLLRQAATTSADNGLTIYQPGTAGKESQFITYAELLKRAEANVPLVHDVVSGDDAIILLHFDRHYDNIIWFWSVVLAGFVPAVSTPFAVDLTQRERHLLHLQTLFANPPILTSERLVEQFLDIKSLRIQAVEKLDISTVSSTESKLYGYTRERDSMAALMLTSGSTGHAKAVVLRHGQMLDSIRGKSEYHETTPDDNLLNWIGFDHVASLTEVHLHAMHLGTDQVHIQAGDLLSDPLLFLQLISKHKIVYTFAPNFFLASIRRAMETGPVPEDLDLSSLRALISGGEANVVETCHEVAQAMSVYGASPDCIRPGFGMTETCAGSIYSKDCPAYDISKGWEFANLGHCIPGISMRVVSEDGTILGTSEAGFLEITGDVVFKGYFNNPTATAESFSQDGWFRTGDLASIDEAGNLKMEGRAKDSIIINGVKYFPTELETALEEAQIAGMTPSYTAVFPHRPQGSSTEALCIVYLPKYEADDTASRIETTDAVAKVTITYCGVRPFKIIPLKEIHMPKTTLGKLSRAKLRKAFEAGEYAECEAENTAAITSHRQTAYAAPTTKMQEDIIAVFRQYFEIPALFGIDQDIFDMGITSVELLRLKSGLEKTLSLPKALPLPTLMTNPTAESLATAIETLISEGSEIRYDPVAVLQPKGNKTPLWLVHPGVGEVMIFMQLAGHITDRPVYALRAKGLDGEGLFANIPEAVATYFAAIRRVQPEGPYAIAGYSYGSNLAFEVAKLIEAEGDEVKFLGAFDQPPQLAARSLQFDWIECVLFVSFFTGLITQEQAKGVNGLGPKLRQLSKDDALDYLIENAAEGSMERYALTPKKISDWADVAFRLKVIGREYDPVGTVARLDCFFAKPLPEVASTNEEWFEGHIRQWEEFVREKDIGYYLMPGTHYDMITTHVMGFQKKLKAVLAERGL